MRNNLVDMVMKMKFGIKKYSQVLNGIGPGYGGLTEFIIIEKHVSFPGEGYNFTFTEVIMYLAVHQPCIELMSDCSRLQFSGD
jgi:hypothetical protein